MSRAQIKSGAVLAAAFIVVACGSAAPPPASQLRTSVASGTAIASVGTVTPVASVAAASAAATTSATATPGATRNPSAGYTDLPGWLVFEHFGQTPDGSTPQFDFNNRMIWMVHADGSGLHELSAGAPAAGKSSPDISPDGGTVAFNTWSEPVQIWTVPIDGGTPTLITTDCDGIESHCMEGEPSYSGDGTKLAFARVWVEKGATFTAIGIRDLGTGHVQMIDSTKVGMSVGSATQPSLSPDASQVTYYVVDQTPSQERATSTRVMVAATDGSSVHELPRPSGSSWASDPDWSPDGKHIVFGTLPNRESEGWVDPPGLVEGGPWTINPDGTDLVDVCADCLRTPIGRGSANVPSWTSDGRILAWGYKTWVLMNADGSDAAHINMPKLTWNGDGLGYNYAAVLQPTN
jgi:Tol biopolymer transport system component